MLVYFQCEKCQKNERISEFALFFHTFLPFPCLNGGQCTDLTGITNSTAGRTCLCVSGFSGDSCETNIDDCATNPCQNGFACIDGVNNYICDCASSSDWSGKNCDFDEFCAEVNPCNGNGVCSSATCTCNNGTDVNGDFVWSGTRCTYKDYCATNSCPSNSVCSYGVLGSECNCDIGYGPAWPATGACGTNVCDWYCQNGASCSVNSTTEKY